MKRLLMFLAALSSATTLAGFGLLALSWRAGALDEITIAPAPNRAAIERTAREIEAFNAETKRHDEAVDRLASWYGIPFDGRLAANGQTYDRWALTCAALDYPLGTWLKVTDRATRRWVIVRVTDRGPFVPGRSIDLSEAAAHQLGIRAQGLARVEVCVLEGRR